MPWDIFLTKQVHRGPEVGQDHLPSGGGGHLLDLRCEGWCVTGL